MTRVHQFLSALLLVALWLPAGARADDSVYGRYYALVVGNNDYAHLDDLKTPVNDASVVADLLRRDYGFEVELMLNATREDLVSAFNRLRHALNAHVQDGVVLRRLETCRDDFHAQFDARGKRYVYRSVVSTIRPAIGRNLCHWVRRPVDIAAMHTERVRRGADHLDLDQPVFDIVPHPRARPYEPALPGGRTKPFSVLVAVRVKRRETPHETGLQRPLFCMIQ